MTKMMFRRCGSLKLKRITQETINIDIYFTAKKGVGLNMTFAIRNDDKKVYGKDLLNDIADKLKEYVDENYITVEDGYINVRDWISDLRKSKRLRIAIPYGEIEKVLKKINGLEIDVENYYKDNKMTSHQKVKIDLGNIKKINQFADNVIMDKL